MQACDLSHFFLMEFLIICLSDLIFFSYQTFLWLKIPHSLKKTQSFPNIDVECLYAKIKHAGMAYIVCGILPLGKVQEETVGHFSR